MKSMQPPLAAIFFMTYFYRAGGGGVDDPLGSPHYPLLGADLYEMIETRLN